QSKDDIKVMWSASYGVIENASSENTKWTAPENTGSYLIEVTITDTEDRIDSLGITVEVAEEFAIEEEVAPLDEIAEEADIVTDIDGNVYHTVTIGTQVWMVENLKVTHYRNGDPIPNVTDGTQWESLKTGAYCSYNNDVNNAITYGSLYNWYAVNDSRNIAPEGWHVPTNAEWETLEMYLGGSVASGKMKETGITHWNSPNTGATNESGFTALPGGYRDYYGPFYLIGYDGFWWSATKSSDPYTWHRLLSYDSSSIGRYGSFSGELGCSIRCLRD
ncbi:MAG: fibrobacter succinogenes major paralogous domain-containing protein, partial [Actinobacteria bacterium]|nr:fibrobacter succinogenes major paralogous domain-containing protein [Actinomycetota bacterium]